jgi:hypothetical protein
MKTKYAALVAILTFTCVTGAEAQTFGRSGGLRPAARQQQRQYRPPTVSPYINLLGSGTDPRITYLGLVQPQLEQQRFDRQQVEDTNRLQQEVRQNEVAMEQEMRRQDEEFRRLAVGLGLKSRETGIQARFQDRSRYFPRLGNR